MKRLLLATILAAGVWPVAARAAPYWVAWEGNDYPENEGWERWQVAGGADRTLSAGHLRLDSRRDHVSLDMYVRNQQSAPTSGELFVAEWRVRVNTSTGPLWDQAVGIATANSLLSLGLYQDAVVSAREGWTLPFQPDEFHTFRVESIDMELYSLFVDGAYARSGSFEPTTVGRSVLTFGDSSSGGLITSSVDWDFVRFGVVPEPSSLLCILVCISCSHFWRKS